MPQMCEVLSDIEMSIPDSHVSLSGEPTNTRPRQHGRPRYFSSSGILNTSHLSSTYIQSISRTKIKSIKILMKKSSISLPMQMNLVFAVPPIRSTSTPPRPACLPQDRFHFVQLESASVRQTCESSESSPTSPKGSIYSSST